MSPSAPSRRQLLTAAGVGAVAATGLTAKTAGPAAAARPLRRRARLVVLVDWDGFDPRYLGRVPTPTLDLLARRGVLGAGRGSFQTISNPVRVTMATGAWPATHGNAAYYYDDARDVVVGQERFVGVETVAQRLVREGLTVASVQWYAVQNYGVTFGDPAALYVQPGGDFGARVDVAIDLLSGRAVDSGGTPVVVPRVPDLLAVYGDTLDALGHANGPDSPLIGEALAAMDAHLGRLVEAVRGLGLLPDTTFVLTSDHGMSGWTSTLLPDAVAAVAATGYVTEVVTPGGTPAAATEVVIVPNAVRYGDISLRGRAATPDGAAAVTAALLALGPDRITQVLTRTDLDALRASDKMGDLVAEAALPWAWAQSVPPPGEQRGSHGGTTELEVPVLVSGAGVRRGRTLVDAVLPDVTPTICALLGLTPPAQAEGRVWDELLLP